MLDHMIPWFTPLIKHWPAYFVLFNLMIHEPPMSLHEALVEGIVNYLNTKGKLVEYAVKVN